MDTLNFSASSGESLIVIEPETVSHDADETTESNYTDLLPCYTSKSSSTLVTHQKCCAYSCLSYFTASEVGNALRFFKCKNIVEQNQFLLDSFKVISNEESINHLICGKQVCRKAYIQILEISEKRYKKILTVFKANPTVKFERKPVIRSLSTKVIEVKTWMARYFDRIGDSMPHIDQIHLPYVTGFDKTRLPHTSNSSNLIASNLTTQYAIALQFSHNAFIALCNNKSNFETDSSLSY